MSERNRSILWLFGLSVLAVGARNFEVGLTLDGPVYATVARTIAQGGDWFRLDALVPDFIPFVEHPHLGFWIGAVLFKVFPAADWSARISSHLFYFGFLTTFYFYLRRRRSEKVAVWSVLLLWSFYRFSNIFSNYYLDPGVLFFGFLAIFLVDRPQPRTLFLLTGGAALALAGMIKGLTILGFFPAVVWILWNLRPRAKNLNYFFLGFFIVAGIYFLAVHLSRVPDFFSLYWSRQITHRFAQKWTLSNLVREDYWRNVLQATYYLAPLALLSLRQKTELRRVAPAWILFLTFAAQFSLSGLVGSQYLSMILPWVAWLIAEGVAELIPFPAGRWKVFTGVLCWVGLALVQYFPLRLHGTTPPNEALAVGELHRTEKISHLFYDSPPAESPFMPAAAFTWYGEVRVSYVTGEAVPESQSDSVYFLTVENQSRKTQMKSRNWCLSSTQNRGTIWQSCRGK